MSNPEWTDPGDWEDGGVDIDGVVRSMRHYLNHKLEMFSNGDHYPPSNPANKTNGYAVAKVPDWQLRQWVSKLGCRRTGVGMSARLPITEYLGGPHEWGYRDITDGTFIEDGKPFEAAETIANLLDALQAMLRASVAGGQSDQELNSLEANARAAIARATGTA